VRIAAVLAGVVASTSAVAVADPPPKPAPRDIVITSPGKRCTRNIVTLALMGGGGAVLGGIGYLLQHDAQANATAVSSDSFTGKSWSTALQKQYDKANAEGVAAGVMYGLGIAAVGAAIVTAIVTEPKEQRTVIHPHTAFRPTLGPARGGAVVGGEWRW